VRSDLRLHAAFEPSVRRLMMLCPWLVMPTAALLTVYGWPLSPPRKRHRPAAADGRTLARRTSARQCPAPWGSFEIFKADFEVPVHGVVRRFLLPPLWRWLMLSRWG
jgi:hypothetical protein